MLALRLASSAIAGKRRRIVLFALFKTTTRSFAVVAASPVGVLTRCAVAVPSTYSVAWIPLWTGELAGKYEYV